MTVDEMRKLVQKHADLETKLDLEGALKFYSPDIICGIFYAGFK